jgi:glycosyltransferase involved in cell wall biosynthesis
MIYPVTTHTIVKNEEKFIWYALESVVDHVEKMLIVDTGSTDKTVQLIKEFIKTHSDKKIIFTSTQISSPREINKLRALQIKQTKTPWFLLLDGDEIWPKTQLLKLLNRTQTANSTTLAVVNRTHNCIGDIWHYLPEKFGSYNLAGRSGHLNIRLMRTRNYTLKGQYPLEGYYYQNKLINNTPGNLEYSETWYLHLTHLSRTSKPDKTFGRRQAIYSLGLTHSRNELPEVIFAPVPKFAQKVTRKRSLAYTTKAVAYDLLRLAKKHMQYFAPAQSEE